MPFSVGKATLRSLEEAYQKGFPRSNFIHYSIATACLTFCSALLPASADAALCTGKITTGTATCQTAASVFLSLDASNSIDATEWDLQMTGYINAFNSQSIRTLLTLRQPLGGVAFAIGDWGGVGNFLETPSTGASNARLRAPGDNGSNGWYWIGSNADIDGFVSQLTAIRAAGRPARGATCIQCGLSFAANSIQTSQYQGSFKTIDISGDGPPNKALLATSSITTYGWAQKHQIVKMAARLPIL